MFKHLHLGELIRSPWSHIAFYVFGFAAFLLTHKISPTSLGGPGLDALVLVAFALSIIGILIWTIFLKGIAFSNWLSIIIVHIAGIATLVWWVTHPS